jgi:hypothetical protein
MNFFVQKVYHWRFKPRLVSGPITAGSWRASAGGAMAAGIDDVGSVQSKTK